MFGIIGGGFESLYIGRYDLHFRRNLMDEGVKNMFVESKLICVGIVEGRRFIG